LFSTKTELGGSGIARNSPKQISSSEVNDFVAAAIENGFDHIEVEIDNLVQLERRRHC
jgi:hypothetical protein